MESNKHSCGSQIPSSGSCICRRRRVSVKGNDICVTWNAFFVLLAAAQALIAAFNMVAEMYSCARSTRASPTHTLGVEARGNVMLAEQRHETHYVKHQTNMAVIYMVNVNQSRYFNSSGCDSQER